MIRRLPLWPTLLVLLAAAGMVRLGLWQLERGHQKEALIARYAANRARPLAPFVALWPVRAEDLFRRTGVTCLGATNWTAQAGRTAAGASGWRHIAGCRTGAEGPGVLVDLGVSRSAAPPRWAGGRVSGRLVWAPSATPLVARLFAPPASPTPLIVSDVAAPGLSPTEPPDPAAIPNNHLSYAVQWFIFAALALAMYGAALWQRARRGGP